MPFFTIFDSLEAIEKLVNDYPLDTSFTGAIFKGAKGIILAKLCHKLNYNELVELYLNHYKKYAKGFYLPQFERLVNYLENDFSK